VTVSTAIGGGGGGAVLIGVGSGGGGDHLLPFTGASQLELFLWVATFLLLSGVILLSLSRRHATTGSAAPPGSLL
jgi:hypothetical protein